MPVRRGASARTADPVVFLPKQERSLRTQAAILEAARETMAEGGIESLTIAGVAARVGLTTGAFYARFRNKEALLNALFDETLSSNESEVEAFRQEIDADEMPLADVIVNLVRRAMRLIRANSALFQLFGSRHDGTEAERMRTIRLLEAVIEPVQDLLRERSLELPHPDPNRAGVMLVVIMHGIVEWALLLRESPTPDIAIQDEELANETIRAVLGYLGLPPNETFDRVIQDGGIE